MAQAFDEDNSIIKKAMKKLKIEEESNLFPETEFNTYQVQGIPELQARAYEEKYDNDEPAIIENDYLIKRNELNSTEIARQFMEENYPEIEFVFTDIIDNEESSIASIHMAQAINGIEVRNSAINVNIDKLTGDIISTGVSVWDNLEAVAVANAIPLELSEAISIAATQLELTSEPIDVSGFETEKILGDHIKVSGVPFTLDHTILARKIYIAVTETTAEQVWELTIEIETDYMIVFVSVDTRKIVKLQDLTNHATYRVVPINSPNIGSYSRVTYKDPFNKDASPLGWHKTNEGSYSDTRGNNVLVYENSDGDDSVSGNKVISGGSSLNFEFTFNEDKKTLEENQNAAAANAFYVCNMLHDIFYKLGFTEINGNFQTNNFSGKGQSNDPVIVRISDRYGKNNAQMRVSKDGISPVLRLYPFYDSKKGVEKDPAFDNQIIIHEYTHGVSNRMIGGPSDIKCLINSVEAQQLNEGFSDFFANGIQFRKNINRNTPIRLFEYIAEGGARNYPITSNTKVNNLKYSDLNPDDVYLGAEIWSVMLHEVFWNLVDAYKSDPNYFVSNEKLSYSPSNYLALRYAVQSFKLMPCTPTFIQARDSYIQAIDSSRMSDGVKSKMICLAWAGFAKRGLGYSAKGAKNGKYTNDYTLPKECADYKNF